MDTGRYATALRANPRWAAHPRALDRLLDAPKDGLAWEADHAVRVADGGGEAAADAVQTLCVPCHRTKTADEARAAAKRRRLAARPADADERRGAFAAAPPAKRRKKKNESAAAVLAALEAGDDDDDSWM